MNWQTPERPPRRTPEAAPKGPKIIVQYRSKGGKTYEIEFAGAVVAVHIAREAEDGSGFRIDAQPAGAAAPVGPNAPAASSAPTIVEGRGATAAEALSAVARAWSEHSPALASFDWDAIARELHVVQAF